MDTKLKKSSKLAKWIIFLAVLLPAVLLVSMYPRMEQLMLQKEEVYYSNASATPPPEAAVDIPETETVTDGTVVADVGIRQDVVNYAVEASYYLYGRMLQEEKGTAVAFDVLDRHGWINDFYTMDKETYYWAAYNPGDASFSEYNLGKLEYNDMQDMLLHIANEDMQPQIDKLAKSYGIVGGLYLAFDEYGMISRIEFVGAGDVEYHHNLYSKARDSVLQYQNNAQYYHSQNDGVDVFEVLPKNFEVIFLIPSDSMFVNQFTLDLEYYVQSFSNPEHLYVEIGAPILILACMIFVALVALILPFFRRLNTGWEKLFSLPLEIIVCLAVGMVALAYLMFETMCYTTMVYFEQSVGSVEILGYILEPSILYGLAVAVNQLGWTALFFLEYICVAHCRQFLCGPIYYFKHRILIVRFLRWIGSLCKRFYHYIVEVDISKGLHSTVLKIVVVNFIIVAGLCCFWVVGIGAVAIYSIVLYVILRKQGNKIQTQYNSILHATKQMAEGELKISLQEDLGMFTPLGEELSKVQEGFSKAVAQEAKSQNMKTELISNVSHDLKTPLTAIITYVNLLKQENISEEDRKSYIQTLDMKSQRLKVLIEDLFEVSKAQSGNIQLNYMDVDVVNLMKQLRLEMEDRLADSDLTFRWSLPEEKVILHLDGQKTYRVFDNLLSNALKYAMPGSRVYVDVVNGEQEVEIVFKNTSAAEIQSDAEQLTERFVRGDASRNSEGSGLGLAIVKSFVELQGGSFRIEIDGDLFKAIIRWKKEPEAEKE